MSTLDGILEQIGEFDFFQKQTLLLLCLLSASFTPVYVGVVSFAFIPEHRCFSPGVAELSQRCGWSLEEQLNLTVPEWGGHGDSFSSRCRRYEVDWNTTGVSCTDPLGSLVGNRSAAPLGPCRDGWVYNSPGTSLVTELNLVFEDSWKLDLFQSCVNAGFFISSMSIGYIGDRFGCKLCLLVTVLVSAISGVLMAFAPSYSWMVIFHLIQCLPETRWLMAQKQNEKAVEVIKLITKGNKKQLPLSFQNLSSKDEDGEKLKPSFLDLVKAPQIRKCSS
ncbi:LOW QUALITY PROTEIN: solute carrier family 22 member 2-like [Heliangelus exortis]|uniref:LOW QUALITY PROTEIN: solute carrier family 22 member 2-like n=1 Tax=Heliangelus exortis TaxID=472823 RepID=UPI003A9423EC